MARRGQLSWMDAAFLYYERPVQRLHVGSLSLLDGPVPYDAFTDLTVERLRDLPRYRQRPVRPVFDWTLPNWQEVPRFDPRHHIRHVGVPPPGGDAELHALIDELMAAPLDPDSPLWETYLIDGLADGRTAILNKIHHCMIDGVSGVQLMSVMFDVSPKPAALPPAPAAAPPPPLPHPMVRLARAIEDGIRGAVALASEAADLVAAPRRAMRAGGELVRALAELTRVLGAGVVPSPYNGHVSTLRRVAWATLPIHELKSVKNRIGGTLNDAILTVISAALRRDLQRRGIDPDGLELRAMCPVNVRSKDEHLHLGNRVSMMVAPLPVGIHDPFERLRQVRAAMARVKASGLAGQVGEVLRLIEWIPAPLQVPLAQLPIWVPPFNTICTNVPGPPVSLYVQGQRLETLVPLVPLAQGIGLAFAILSYADTITIGITADPALVGDPTPLAEALIDAHQELCQVAGVERLPPRQAPVAPERQRRRPTRVA